MHPDRVPFVDYLGVDSNRGVSLLGESTTPGFQSILGVVKQFGTLHPENPTSERL